MYNTYFLNSSQQNSVKKLSLELKKKIMHAWVYILIKDVNEIIKAFKILLCRANQEP